jgi:HK97 family phage portal protein
MSMFRERRDALGNGTYNPFDNPSLPLASVGFDSVYGLLQRQNNNSGETVTVDRGMAIPTLWRCVGLLATVIAGCPLLVYKDPDKKIIKVPCLDPANTATTYTQYELWSLVVSHIALWGNAYILKVRNGGDMIVDLRPITPSLVEVKATRRDETHPDGKLYLVKQVNPDGTVAKTVELTSYEIMHIPGLGYDGLHGLSPLQVCAQTLGTSIAADKLAARFFSHGTQLSGVINVKAPLADQEQADNIKRRWQTINAGTHNAAEVAVLDAETTFQPLTIPPDSLQFLQSRQWQTEEIARIYGIPPHLVGDETKSTSWGSGIEQQNIGFVAYTVAGWTTPIQQRVSREIVNTRGQYASFDLTELMRGSSNERFQAYALGIQWGWLTRNEARIAEDKPPLPGLDKPLTPLNMVVGTGNQNAPSAQTPPGTTPNDVNAP